MTDSSIYEVLRAAAALWFEAHPKPAPMDYSTAQNDFLILAEMAYFSAGRVAGD